MPRQAAMGMRGDMHLRLGNVPGGAGHEGRAWGATLQTNPRSSFYGEPSPHQANGGQSRVRSGVKATAGMKLRW